MTGGKRGQTEGAEWGRGEAWAEEAEAVLGPGRAAQFTRGICWGRWYQVWVCWWGRAVATPPLPPCTSLAAAPLPPPAQSMGSLGHVATANCPGAGKRVLVALGWEWGGVAGSMTKSRMPRSLKKHTFILYHFVGQERGLGSPGPPRGAVSSGARGGGGACPAPRDCRRPRFLAAVGLRVSCLTSLSSGTA